jgi:hypothetical protein
VEVSGSVVFDWYTGQTIVRDTLIDGKTFYVFSTGEILRSSDVAVLRWNGSSESILYAFDVSKGDTTWAYGLKSLVVDVYTDTVFHSPQTVVEISNGAISADTVFSARYSKKFGLLFTQKWYLNRIWRLSLAGALIDSVTYGSL